MFLVRAASEVMDPDIEVLPVDASFDEYLRQPQHAGRLRHVVVTDKGNIYGVIRVNTGLRRGLEAAHTGVSLGDVASRNFIVVREDETAYDVIRRMWRRNAIMAVVVRAGEVAGVITKEHVADSVADSIKAYAE
jgi:CIC family chloride channel protein